MDRKEQFQYQNQFIAEKYDRFTATFPAGRKELYRNFSLSHGESLNAYINRLIVEDMSFPESYRNFAESQGETLHEYLKRLMDREIVSCGLDPENEVNIDTLRFDTISFDDDIG